MLFITQNIDKGEMSYVMLNIYTSLFTKLVVDRKICEKKAYIYIYNKKEKTKKTVNKCSVITYYTFSYIQ